MAGVNNNLIPGDRRSHENNQANGRKGGIASGEAKKKKKATKDLIRLVLASPVDVSTKKGREAMRKVGYDVAEQGPPSVEMLMALQIATQAMAGDLSSARFLYDYAQIGDLKASLERERIKAARDQKQTGVAAVDVEDLTVLADLLEANGKRRAGFQNTEEGGKNE